MPLFFDTIFSHCYEVSRLKMPILRYFPPFSNLLQGLSSFFKFFAFCASSNNDARYLELNKIKIPTAIQLDELAALNHIAKFYLHSEYDI